MQGLEDLFKEVISTFLWKNGYYKKGIKEGKTKGCVLQ